MLATKDTWCSIQPLLRREWGQVGDTGMIAANGVQVRVLDTVKSGETHLHRVMVEEGTLEVGLSVMRMLRHPGEPRLRGITRRRICFTRRCGKYSARTSIRGVRSLMMRSFALIFPTSKRSLMKNSVRSSSVLMRKSCVTRTSSLRRWQ